MCYGSADIRLCFSAAGAERGRAQAARDASARAAEARCFAIESRIAGQFTGTINGQEIELENGQRWRQTSFRFVSGSAIPPYVVVFGTAEGAKMMIGGATEPITVERVR